MPQQRRVRSLPLAPVRLSDRSRLRNRHRHPETVKRESVSLGLQVIGIDPGLSGALALVGSRGLEACVDMPVMDRGSGSGAVKHQVNGAALAQLLKEWTSGHDN